MSRTDPVITEVSHHRLPTHYPRTVGRNARLGSHGDGGESAVVVLRTDSGATGWAMTEQSVAPGLDDTLTGRPGRQHVIVTGRNAKQPLIDAADLVTEMTLVKHHFAAGVKAQEGIEF